MPSEIKSHSGTGKSGAQHAVINYQNIARQIRDGSCVLFLGPSAIVAKDASGSYVPLMTQCARQMASSLDLSAEERDSLVHVTSTLRYRKVMLDTMIIAAVQGFYENAEKQAALHPLLESLSDLPFRIVVNTTPDDFFARFYAQALRDYQFEYFNYRKSGKDPMFEFLDNSPPLIYNLFGYYKKPESMVLTHSDQLGYVNKITGAQHERLPDSLLAAFNVPRSYLFLGFDFEDWSLRVLLDALFKNARNNIEPFAYPLKGFEAVGPRAKVFFQSEFRMEFPETDMETFLDELLKHYRELDGESASDPGYSQKKVLILHNEAQDDAECNALIQHLGTLKVKVTTVKDALGAGDILEWTRKMIDEHQMVIPLMSAGFFSEDNPFLPLMEELVRKNNPREGFLVMPVLLKPVSFAGTGLDALRTIRPPKNQAVYGDGQEDKHFADIVQALKRYIDSLK